MRIYGLLVLIFVFASCGPSGPSGPPACVSNSTLLCEAGGVVEINSCTEARTRIEECPEECLLGECTSCAPTTGVVCVGEERFAVDSCGNLEDMIQVCPNGCIDGFCIDPECTLEGDRICEGDLVIEVDSCDNQRTIVTRCPAERPCENGRCDGCGLPDVIACFDGDLYEYDACGEQVGLAGICDASCDGQALQCSEEECTPNAGIVCHEGNMHFRDSCEGVQAEIQEECEGGCNANGCIDECPESVVGRTCFEGNVHAMTRGCESAPVRVTAIIESCPDGCVGGSCASVACPENQGAVCEENERFSVDGCGVRGERIEVCEGECQNAKCVSE